MVIEITNPELEALIQERLRSGRFRSAEELIFDALSSPRPRRRSGAELVAAMQASLHKNIDLEPTRGPAPIRDVVL